MAANFSKEAYLIIDKAIEAGNYDQALQFSKARIKNVPDDPFGPFWLGVSLFSQERYSEACIAFKRALSQDENHFSSLAYMAYVKSCVCDWSGLDDLAARLFSATDEDFETGKLWLVDPLKCLPLYADIPFQHKLAQSRAKYYYSTRPTLKIKGYHKPVARKLKIGYLSPDFTNDASGLLIRSLFSFHDRDKFKVYCYSLRNSEGMIREKIEEGCDVFTDISGITDFEAAKRIYADGIHILIDLRGYHPRAKTRILAMKPAPIQCQFFGYPGTMGASYIHNHLTSEEILPEAFKEFYSETVYYLPNVPFASPPFTAVEELDPVDKVTFGLPKNAFVFCCFCKPQAIDETVFTAWMNILKETDNSVLWLQGGNLQCEENLQIAAQKAGIEPSRIVFSASENITARWRHRAADLWLDPFLISSKTAVVLSAWVGLPVLTCKGSLPQSRIAASYSRGAGCPDLIVDSPEEYMKTAIDLYNDRDRLDKIREELMSNRYNSQLFNPAGFIEHLEEAYTAMWQARNG